MWGARRPQAAVRGSQFAVRGSQFAVRGSQFAVRSSQFAGRRSRAAGHGPQAAVGAVPEGGPLQHMYDFPTQLARRIVQITKNYKLQT